MKAIAKIMALRHSIMLFAFFSLAGCGRDYSEGGPRYAEPYSETQEAIESAGDYDLFGSVQKVRQEEEERPSEPNLADKKLIKTVQMRFEVSDYKEALSKVKQLIGSHQAYTAGAREDHTSRGIEGVFRIRVPASRLDGLHEELLALARSVDYNQMSVQDVSEEFADVEARIKAKKKAEERYIELLQQAKNVKEVLEVEAQLRTIREEIEAREGRLKYLSNQVTYSTIELYMYQRTNPYQAEKSGFLSRIADGLQSGWEALLGTIVDLFYAWPLLLLLGAVLTGWRMWRRKRANKAA